ncbi:hypothetical protein E0J02_27405 [Rhizobium leguminosarum bv. viciae]|nr:hypothetical protein E0J02_27405 [Rhizobium leguminosarum bv. viciae]
MKTSRATGSQTRLRVWRFRFSPERTTPSRSTKHEARSTKHEARSAGAGRRRSPIPGCRRRPKDGGSVPDVGRHAGAGPTLFLALGIRLAIAWENGSASGPGRSPSRRSSQQARWLCRGLRRWL